MHYYCARRTSTAILMILGCAFIFGVCYVVVRCSSFRTSRRNQKRKSETKGMSQERKIAIAECHNAKVAELTPPQPVVTRILATLIALLSIVLATALTSSTAVTPRVTATFSPGRTIDYLLHASPTQQQCHRVTESFTQSISSNLSPGIQTGYGAGDLHSMQLEVLAVAIGRTPTQWCRRLFDRDAN